MTEFSGLDDGLGRSSSLDVLSPQNRVIMALLSVVVQASVLRWSSLAITAAVPLVVLSVYGFQNYASAFRRAGVTSIFIVLMVTLTWSSEEPRLWGILSLQGLEASLKIAARLHLISATLMPLVLALGVRRFEKVLYDFRVPEKFRLLLLMTVRSIFMLNEQVSTMNNALKLRIGGRGSTMVAFKGYAAMLGTTLLHCADRSERVCQAMECRGGLAGFGRRSSQPWKRKDGLWCLLCVVLNVVAWGVPSWLLV